MMFPLAYRIARVHRAIEQSACPSYALMSDVVATICPRYLHGRDDRSVRLRHWLETNAFREICLALVDWELPGWSVFRLAQDEGAWQCELNPRQSAGGGDTEVEESHDDETLAILEAFLTALCHVLPKADAKALPPTSLGHPDAMARWW